MRGWWLFWQCGEFGQEPCDLSLAMALGLSGCGHTINMGRSLQLVALAIAGFAFPVWTFTLIQDAKTQQLVATSAAVALLGFIVTSWLVPKVRMGGRHREAAHCTHAWEGGSLLECMGGRLNACMHGRAAHCVSACALMARLDHRHSP